MADSYTRVTTRALLSSLPPVSLTTEYRLQAILIEHFGHWVSYDNLIHGLWGYREPADAKHSLSIYVLRLRRNGWRIRNVWGIGYALVSAPRSFPEPVMNPRASQALALRWSGFSNREIADRLAYASANTVSQTIRRELAKAA